MLKVPELFKSISVKISAISVHNLIPSRLISGAISEIQLRTKKVSNGQDLYLVSDLPRFLFYN